MSAQGAGWVDVPGKGRRWRTSQGTYMLQRPAGDALSGLLGSARNLLTGADRALGGWIPGGGVASPLTRARQEGEQRLARRVEQSRERVITGQPSPGQLASLGQVPNAIGASLEAGVNPVKIAIGDKTGISQLSAYYGARPQEANKYDLSTNLFLRYLSGAGKEGLTLSQDQGRAIRSSIEEQKARLQDPVRREQASTLLDSAWKGASAGLDKGDTPVWIQGSSDAIAPLPGRIPADRDGRGELVNSLGSFWASPAANDSYRVQERYNFTYATDDKDGNPAHRETARRIAAANPLYPKAIGARITSLGYGTPFDYELTVGPDGSAVVR